MDEEKSKDERSEAFIHNDDVTCFHMVGQGT